MKSHILHWQQDKSEPFTFGSIIVNTLQMYKNTMASFHRIAERNPELLKYYKAPVGT